MPTITKSHHVDDANGEPLLQWVVCNSRNQKDWIKSNCHQFQIYKWVEEFFGVLWSYYTTTWEPTWSSPFSLVYGTDAVIPAEIAKKTIRIGGQLKPLNNQMQKLALDESQKLWEAKAIKSSQYQQLASQHYNANVWSRQFRIGDKMLCKVFQNAQDLNARKLGPNWVEPYTVISFPWPSIYRLHSNSFPKIIVLAFVFF